METTTTAIAEYSAVESGLADLRTRYGNVAWDLRTVKGNAEARAARKELVTLRTSLDAKRKELKEPILERAKLIDSEAKRITAELLKLEKPIDDAIKADELRRERERKEREVAEAKRVARLQDSIQAITATALRAVGKHSTEIADEIEALEAFEIGADYDEFRAGAQAAKDSTLSQLHTLFGAALANEQEAARLAMERAEFARQQAEAKRLADEQAAVLAEQQRIERERIEAQRAEQERMDAAVRADMAEQDRLQREARAAQQAKEDAERAERQRVIDAENARVAAENAAQAARIAEERAALSRKIQAEEEQRAAQERANEAAVRELFWHAESKVVHQETPDIVIDLPIILTPIAATDYEGDCPPLDEIVKAIAVSFKVYPDTARRWLRELAPTLSGIVSDDHPVIESLEP